MGFYGDEFHTTRFDHLVVNELESLILSKEVLQEVEAIVDQKQQTKKEMIWRQRLM
jgi:hypothetical protein